MSLTDFFIGDLVSLQSKLPYLKTVDTMPMLRPADLVSIGEVGEIVGIRAMSQHFFDLYNKEYQELFLQVKPGIISPIFDEKTDTFETIQKIEQSYLEQYLKHPIRTDIKYLWLTVKQILKGVRSK